MPFDPVIANPGVGGVSFAMDTFTDTDGVSKTICYMALASGALNGPYTVATATSGFPVKEQRPTTGTPTNVAGSATSVQLLATNTSRLGAYIFNDSSAVMYVKLGTGATTSSYCSKVFPDTGWPVPFGYTGVVEAVWESATGNARVTELS